VNGTPGVRLVALGWDHDRCMRPMEACSRAWTERHPHVEVVWERRSLTDFGDQPLEDVAHRYDLLVIDHPFCGVAAETRCLWPLDDLLPRAALDALAATAVGPSHRSYSFAGHQWGLATDAACQVSAVAPAVLGDRPVPRDWDEVLALARDLPGGVALPLSPAHAISSYLTLCANAGAPATPTPERLVAPDAGERAAEILLELAAHAPREALAWEPPDALGRLTSRGELAYIPLTYGFVSYSTPGGSPRPCRFVDIPGGAHGPAGAVLGGAGLAVSATTEHPHEAAAFAAWASGPEAQAHVVAPNGGQPGSRVAWEDEALDASAGGFFSGTLRTIESAWLRPRESWWPTFQMESGTAITAALGARGSAAEIHASVEAAYQRALARSTA
jgi:multiple sugar transport system substrate-binding protein